MKKLMIGLLATLFLAISSHAAEEALVLPTISGKKIHVIGTQNGLKFQEYQGKVVFLEFWGTHCPPCRMSIPNYIKLQKKYKNKLAIVAIEVQDTPKEALKTFVKEQGINYNVIAYRDAVNFVGYISKRARWQGSIPFLIILDKNGNVVTMQVGLLNEKALDGLVAKLSEIPSKTGKKAPSESNASKAPSKK